MVDLLGPGAFGAARPATSRPAITPANGAGDPDTWAKDCSDPITADGTEDRAALLNMLLAQLRATIRRTGVTESNLDDDMVARAIRSQRSNFVAAAGVGGSANAITLAFSPAFASLADLMGVPLVFLAEAANTGAVTVNVDGLGAVAVTWRDSSPLAAGDIASGEMIILRHNGTNFTLYACQSPTQTRALALRRTIVSYLTAGTFTYTVPANKTLLELEGVGSGAGGAAGASGSPGGAASGGSAGCAGRRLIDVLPADTLEITVPAGGAGGISGTSGPGAGDTLTVVHKRSAATLETLTLSGGIASTNQVAGGIGNAVTGASTGTGWDQLFTGGIGEGGRIDTVARGGNGGDSAGVSIAGQGGKGGVSNGNPGIAAGAGGAGGGGTAGSVANGGAGKAGGLLIRV
jgi:hypothetical protein